MKKLAKKLIYPLFTAAYAAFFSLGMTCLFHLFGIALGIALDGNAVARSYPRFIPFCIILGLFALAAIILLVFLNVKYSKKWNYTKTAVVLQSICAFVLSVPMLQGWLLLFEYLENAL